MSDFITMQVGQCGNQIGRAFWPHALEEYGGTNQSGSQCNDSLRVDRSFKSFFNCPEGLPYNCSYKELKKHKITARALLIDMEERVVDRYRVGSLQHLFDKKFTLSDYSGSGNNWGVGHYLHYGRHQVALEDMVRRAAEQCCSLQGFLVLMSLGGGTGAGLGTAMLYQLEDVFPRVDRFVMCVHPGEYNDVVISPYNVAHSLRVLSEHASCVIPVDNKALSDICSRHQLSKEVKPFQDVNRIIVNMLLNLTSGSRFAGSLNCDLSDLNTLVPRPGLHYLSTSLSPLNYSPPQHFRYVNQQLNLVQEVCRKENQLLRINALGGQLFNAALLCRGEVSLSLMRDFVGRFRSRVRFAKWSHPGVKVGICSVPPLQHKSAMLCVANSSSMADFFTDSLHHFDRLYNKKAHIHHYTKVDGFEKEDFDLTRESLLSSALQYSESTNFVEVPRLQIN